MKTSRQLLQSSILLLFCLLFFSTTSSAQEIKKSKSHYALYLGAGFYSPGTGRLLGFRFGKGKFYSTLEIRNGRSSNRSSNTDRSFNSRSILLGYNIFKSKQMNFILSSGIAFGEGEKFQYQRVSSGGNGGGSFLYFPTSGGGLSSNVFTTVRKAGIPIKLTAISNKSEIYGVGFDIVVELYREDVKGGVGVTFNLGKLK